jgi:pimeloyl-ACP methyl ester carboxylesterase
MRSSFFIRGLKVALGLPMLTGPIVVAQVLKTDIDLRAKDGTLLKVTYFSPGKPGPGVVLLHMCDDDDKPKRKAWDNLGAMLAARGVHAVAMDYRGYGESGGGRIEKAPMKERRRVGVEVWPGDIDVVFDHFVTLPGVDRARIGAAGGSCGAANAVLLAKRHPEVKTLVLLAGGESAAKDFLPRVPWLPVFAVSSRDDRYDAAAAMRRVVGFSTGTANRLREYDGGGHGTDLFRKHPELEAMIADWFVQHLITKPVRNSPGPW